MIYSAIAFFLLLALVAVSAVEFRDYSSYTFEHFESEFGKSYPDNVARNHARANFMMNLHKIIRHNADHTQSYSMGVNKFTDLSAEELVGRYTGYNSAMARSVFGGAEALTINLKGGDYPAALDYRTTGKVTAVKDQGGCGSCWAFSATESIESALAVTLNTTASLILSPQNVVDCTPNPLQCGGTGGCNGATQELAFDWAAGGIALESAYPYKGVTGTCNTGVTKAAKVGAYAKLATNNADVLIAALNIYGPIAISVAASSWGSYSSGVFNGCGKDWIINHAVQLVGYGTDNGTNYWIVRNSWGTSWGEQGYIRLLRAASGKDEVCGTDTAPGDGSGCKGGPSTVQVCGTCGVLSDSSVPIMVTQL